MHEGKDRGRICANFRRLSRRRLLFFPKKKQEKGYSFLSNLIVIVNCYCNTSRIGKGTLPHRPTV